MRNAVQAVAHDIDGSPYELDFARHWDAFNHRCLILMFPEKDKAQDLNNLPNPTGTEHRKLLTWANCPEWHEHDFRPTGNYFGETGSSYSYIVRK